MATAKAELILRMISEVLQGHTLLGFLSVWVFQPPVGVCNFNSVQSLNHAFVPPNLYKQGTSLRKAVCKLQRSLSWPGSRMGLLGKYAAPALVVPLLPSTVVTGLYITGHSQILPWGSGWDGHTDGPPVPLDVGPPVPLQIQADQQ